MTSDRRNSGQEPGCGKKGGKQTGGSKISKEGWYSLARRLPSPNCNERPVVSGSNVSLLVIHNISLPPGEFGGCYIEQLFTNCLPPSGHPCFAELDGLEVSAHVLIKRDGECVQFVSFTGRAWHAGTSCFRGREHCNDYSIGIELEGTDLSGYTDTQYLVLAEVTQALLDRYPAISRERIVGHSDIAPDRKTDPGPGFDWKRFLSLVTCVNS